MSRDPFKFDDALEKALADYPVPNMSGGFADRVVAATEGRAAPLPRARPAPAQRWRSGRRLVIGAVAAVTLGGVAAAGGIFENLRINITSIEEVWKGMTSEESQQDSATVPVSEPPRSFIPEAREPVLIEGPIDTPEELEEAFRRIDNVRNDRRETRRENVDRRIDRAIERRRDLGLPAPTAEQEERLRGRIEQFRENADARREERTGTRREELRERIEDGDELTPEDLIRSEREGALNGPRADRLERFRQLSPEERRERIRQFRERRLERLQRGQEIAPNDDPEPTENDPPEKS